VGAKRVHIDIYAADTCTVVACAGGTFVSDGRRRDDDGDDTNLGHAVTTGPLANGRRRRRRGVRDGQRPTVLTALRETTAVAEVADRAMLPVCDGVAAAVWRWPGGPPASAAASAAVNRQGRRRNASGRGIIL